MSKDKTKLMANLASSLTALMMDSISDIANDARYEKVTDYTDKDGNHVTQYRKKSRGRSLCERHIRAIESGKNLKLDDGTVYDIQGAIKESIENTIGARFDNLPDHSDATIDPDAKLVVNPTSDSILQRIGIAASGEGNSTPTIVTQVSYSDIKEDGFRAVLDSEGSINALFHYLSNLRMIMNGISKNFDKLASVCKHHNGVVFIPDIVVFTNPRGEILKKPFKVNLLIMITAKKYNLESEEEPEKMLDNDPTFDNVLKTLEAAVRMKCRNLLLDPYDVFVEGKKKKSLDKICSAWLDAFQMPRYKNAIDNITLSIQDENEYLIFNSRLSAAAK